MPIAGMTNRGLAFPQIGVIKKGSPKEKRSKDGREYEIQGKDLKHFRVEFDAAEERIKQIFENTYGKEPTQMRVTFPFNEIDRVWDAWLEAYTANRLIARSDGERIIYWRDGKEKLVKDGIAQVTREMKIWKKVDGLHTEPLVVSLHEGEPTPYIENMVFHRTEKTLVEAKPVGRLRVVLPELKRLGYLVLQTTSINDIIAIGGPESGELGAIKMLCDNLNLPLAGVPMILRRKPKDIAYTDKNGKSAKMTRWLVHIEADPIYVESVLERMQKLAMPAPVAMLTATTHIEKQESPLFGVNEPEEIDEEETLIPPEDFEEGSVSEPEVPPTAPPAPEPVEMIKTNGEWAVGQASSQWNCSMEQAARDLFRKYHGEKVAKSEFLKWLKEPQKA